MINQITKAAAARAAVEDAGNRTRTTRVEDGNPYPSARRSVLPRVRQVVDKDVKWLVPEQRPPRAWIETPSIRQGLPLGCIPASQGGVIGLPPDVHDFLPKQDGLVDNRAATARLTVVEDARIRTWSLRIR